MIFFSWQQEGERGRLRHGLKPDLAFAIAHAGNAQKTAWGGQSILGKKNPELFLGPNALIQLLSPGFSCWVPIGAPPWRTTHDHLPLDYTSCPDSASQIRQRPHCHSLRVSHIFYSQLEQMSRTLERLPRAGVWCLGCLC